MMPISRLKTFGEGLTITISDLSGRDGKKHYYYYFARISARRTAKHESENRNRERFRLCARFGSSGLGYDITRDVRFRF